MPTNADLPGNHDFRNSAPSPGAPDGSPDGAPDAVPGGVPDRVDESAPKGDQSETASQVWNPPGYAFDDLPSEVQQVINDVIRPAYDKLVRRAPTGAEQSSGLSIVNLLWVEVIDHWRMGDSGIFDYYKRDILETIGKDSPDKIYGRFAQTIGLKLKATNALRQYQQSQIQIASDRHALVLSLRALQDSKQSPRALESRPA